jgi:hypothetical protein
MIQCRVYNQTSQFATVDSEIRFRPEQFENLKSIVLYHVLANRASCSHTYTSCIGRTLNVAGSYLRKVPI